MPLRICCIPPLLGVTLCLAAFSAVDSGGGDNLAVLNRIRFAFDQASVGKPAHDGIHTAPR